MPEENRETSLLALVLREAAHLEEDFLRLLAVYCGNGLSSDWYCVLASEDIT